MIRLQTIRSIFNKPFKRKEFSNHYVQGTRQQHTPFEIVFEWVCRYEELNNSLPSAREIHERFNLPQLKAQNYLIKCKQGLI